VEEQKERGLEAAHLLQKKFNSLMIHAWEGCSVQEIIITESCLGTSKTVAAAHPHAHHHMRPL
jgi:hypothetical protein